MPDWKQLLRERMGSLALPAEQEEETFEELAGELEERYQRALRRGHTETQAMNEVLTEIAKPQALADQVRRARFVPAPPREPVGVQTREGGIASMFHDFLQDVRYSARMLAKSPLFTLVAVASLALGIGANTTIFTLVNSMLLNPLPLPDTDTLVAVFTSDARNTGRFQNYMQTSYPNYRDYREQNTVFSGLAGQQFAPVSLISNGEPQQIVGEIVTGNYFDVIGAQPAAGRFFSFTAEEDQQLGAHQVVVLGNSLWKRRFGGDAAIIGKKIELNRQFFTVVAVAPPNFRGLSALGGGELWVPFSERNTITTGFVRQYMEDRRALLVSMVGRLKPGVSLTQAEAAMKTIARNLEQAYPKENDSRTASLRPIKDATFFNPEFRRDMVSAGASLMAVVGIVLLIACANVANLLLARAGARQREVAVRISLGASRSRLVRQMLTESMLLATLAGAAGIGVAYWSRQMLWSQRPANLGADALNLAFDARTLLFTLGVSLLTGVLFGLIPALQISRPNLAVSLKDRTAQPSSGRGWFSLRNALVMAQVALSLIALVGAGLFMRSMQSAQSVDPGFDTEKLALLSFDTGAEGYAREKSDEFMRLAVERVQALPMVEAAVVAQSPPLTGGLARTVFPEGLDFNDRRNGKLTQLNQVGPAYFETLGIPVVRGRAFTERDREGAPMVAIINEAMAESMWPGQDVVGKRFRCFGEPWLVEIVGVAKTAKYLTLGEEPLPFFYFPALQHETPAATLHVRVKGDPASALGAIRTTVQQLDARMPLTGVITVSQLMSNVLWAPRMGAMLLSVFGMLALGLAALGIHGVVSYSVSQRTQEIGVRMALGATPGRVTSMVLSRAMLIVAIGTVAGAAGAFALARGLRNLLIGVNTNDPFAFGLTALLLLGVAALASYLPARRAARIDPLLALRHE